MINYSSNITISTTIFPVRNLEVIYIISKRGITFTCKEQNNYIGVLTPQQHKMLLGVFCFSKI